jgi:transcriptional regulator with XRE-family HTH domain
VIRIGTTQDLADTVGLLRQLAGITQTALAEVMGCHPARIGEYERHRRKVSVRVALIHLKALGYELAIVPLKPDAPGVAPGSTESAEQASGVDGEGRGDSRAAGTRSGGEA